MQWKDAKLNRFFIRGILISGGLWDSLEFLFCGKQIDQIRVGENGFYQETRQKIRENVIGKAEELAEKIKNKKDGKKLDEEKTDAESKHDREDIEEKNPFPAGK